MLGRRSVKGATVLTAKTFASRKRGGFSDYEKCHPQIEIAIRADFSKSLQWQIIAPTDRTPED